MALSIAMSLRRSVFLAPGLVAATSSPRRKKPKKHVTQTAHSMIYSCWSAYGDQSAFSCRRIAGPIGRRGLVLLEDLRMPRSTRESFGIGTDLGSGRLLRMCR